MSEQTKHIEVCQSEQVGAEIVNAATGDKFDALVTEALTGEQPAQPYTSWIVEFKSLLILFLRKLYYTPLSLFSNTSIKDFIAGLQATIVTLQATIASMLGDIATSYQKVGEKGGTLPQEQTSANLPAAIESIPQGSGDEKVCDGTYTCNMSFEWHEGFENSITVIRGYLILGASYNNSTVINRDIEFKRLKQITGNNAIFRFVTMNGDLYLPELEQTNVSGDYGMVLNYSSVRDIYLPKLRIGYIGFIVESARNIYLGATKGGNIKIGYYGFGNFNRLIFSNGFGNSFDYKNLNRPKQELLDNINALYDFATDPLEGFTPILSIGSTNLAKLSDDEKAIATNKGWTLT